MPNTSRLPGASSYLDGTSEVFARYIRAKTAQGIQLARLALGIARDEQAPAKARTEARRFLMKCGFVTGGRRAAIDAPSTNSTNTDATDGGSP